MQALLDLLKKSPFLFLLFALVMLAKVTFDKRVEGLAEEIRDIGKTSLAVKQQLREQEREELLAFREAITRREHYLETESAMLPELLKSDDGISSFYKKEGDLYLEVSISNIRLRTPIRDEALSQKVLDNMVKLRNTCNPLANNLVAKLLAIDEELAPIEKKLKLFLDREPSDSSIGFTREERQQCRGLLEKQTTVIAEFQA